MKKVKYLLGIIVGLVIMSFPMFVSAKTITLNDVYTEMEKTKTEWCKNCTVTKENNKIKISYGYSNWVSTFTYKEDLGVIDYLSGFNDFDKKTSVETEAERSSFKNVILAENTVYEAYLKAVSTLTKTSNSELSKFIDDFLANKITLPDSNKVTEYSFGKTEGECTYKYGRWEYTDVSKGIAFNQSHVIVSRVPSGDQAMWEITSKSTYSSQIRIVDTPIYITDITDSSVTYLLTLPTHASEVYILTSLTISSPEISEATFVSKTAQAGKNTISNLKPNTNYTIRVTDLDGKTISQSFKTLPKKEEKVEEKEETKEEENEETSLKKNYVGSPLYLKAGDKINISKRVKDASNLNWTSSDSSVAKVSSNGTITALKEGTATITAENDDLTFVNMIYVYKEVKSSTSNKDVSLLTTNDITDSNIELKVNKIDSKSKEYKEVKSKIDDCNKMELYDITIYSNNQKVQPKGEIILEINIPEGFDKNKIAVFRVEEDGKLTKLDIEIVNGKIQVKTNHFSNYVVAQLNNDTNVTETGDSINNPKTGASVPFIVISMLFAISGAIYLYTRKKKLFIKL